MRATHSNINAVQPLSHVLTFNFMAKLEDTARYAGLLVAPAKGFGPRPRAFFSTCHLSPVRCQTFFLHIYFILFLLSQKEIGQCGGASRWRVIYQRGLPRLVYNGKSYLQPFVKLWET